MGKSICKQQAGVEHCLVFLAHRVAIGGDEFFLVLVVFVLHRGNRRRCRHETSAPAAAIDAVRFLMSRCSFSWPM
jgi:hypothetical protein